MNKKTIKIVAIIIACLFLLGIAAPFIGMFVFAVPTDSTLQEYEQKEKSALDDLQELEKQINQAGERVYQAEQAINSTEEQLESINNELADIEEKEQEQMGKFKKRITAVCESEGFSYLGLIFSAENFSDFIDKLVIAQELAAYDKNVLDSMDEIKKKITDRQAEAEELKNGQEKSKTELEEAMAELYQKSADAAAYMEELQNDKAAYEKYLKDKEQEERLAKQRAGIQYSTEAADLSKVSGGMFLWPANTSVITSSFSPSRVNPVTGITQAHTGTDIGAVEGAPIWASQSGTVSLAEFNGGYGNCVIINHGNGVSTLYGHMSAILVNAGDTVAQGEQIGRVGSTGNSTGPHLHFEILIDGTAVDPMQFF